MSGANAREDLRDVEMLEEMELVGNLVVAASAAPARRLTLDEIDHALGLPSQGMQA
jgi:hypothetical protein